MVKITGPLLSTGAHGSVDKILNFSKKRTGQQARKYHKPTGPGTEKQFPQRNLTRFLMAQWQAMSAATKSQWGADALAADVKLPGYHYFLKKAWSDLNAHHGLEYYLPLNELVGGNYKDWGPFGYTFFETLTRTVAGVCNNCAKKDKVDNASIYIPMPDRLKVPTTWSWLGWAWIDNYPDVAEGQASIVSAQKNAPPWSQWLLYIWQGTNKFYARIWDTDSNNQIMVGPVPILKKWYQLGVSMDGAAGRFYVNGVKVATSGVLNGTIINNHYLYFGRNAASGAGRQALDGKLDEITYYNRVLSDTEFEKRYDLEKNFI